MWSIFNIISNLWLLAFIPLLLIIFLSRLFITASRNYFSIKRIFIAASIWVVSGICFYIMGSLESTNSLGMVFFKVYAAMGIVSIAVLFLPIKALKNSSKTGSNHSNIGA
jgi:hypothetical protein